MVRSPDSLPSGYDYRCVLCGSDPVLGVRIDGMDRTTRTVQRWRYVFASRECSNRRLLAVKVKHVLIVGAVIVAGLFLFHNYMSHGGFGGIKSGLGLGGYGSGG